MDIPSAQNEAFQTVERGQSSPGSPRMGDILLEWGLLLACPTPALGKAAALSVAMIVPFTKGRRCQSPNGAGKPDQA